MGGLRAGSALRAGTSVRASRSNGDKEREFLDHCHRRFRERGYAALIVNVTVAA